MELAIVRLDKQGATSSKEEKTVDAIVRPQLTRHSITPSHTNNQLSVVVFLLQQKFLKKFWEWVSGPPPFSPVPVLPPPLISLERVAGYRWWGLDENHSQLGVVQMRIIRI